MWELETARVTGYLATGILSVSLHYVIMDEMWTISYWNHNLVYIQVGTIVRNSKEETKN